MAWLLELGGLVTVVPVSVVEIGESRHHRAVVVNDECICGRPYRDRLHLCLICGISECECPDRP